MLTLQTFLNKQNTIFGITNGISYVGSLAVAYATKTHLSKKNSLWEILFSPNPKLQKKMKVFRLFWMYWNEF